MMRLDENVFHHKEHSEDAERRVEFLPITAKAVDSHVGDYTTENTIGDAISQRHHDDGNECRYRLGIVVEVDVLDWRHHKQTYDEQHRGGGCRRNGKEDRSKEQRYDEANGGREGCETGTAAQRYTRRTLYVCGGGTCTYACARNGGNSVCHERFVESGDTTIGAHHACLGTYANEGAHGVEHIDKEEGEYHYEHVERQDVVELKLTEQRADGRRCVDDACERSDAHRNTQQGCSENTDEQSSWHILYNEHRGEDDANNAEQGCAVGHVANANEGGCIVYDDACILESDEGYEESDSSSDSSLYRGRNSINDKCANLGESEQHKDDTLDKDCRQSKLPRVAHGEADGEYKERIETLPGASPKGFFA